MRAVVPIPDYTVTGNSAVMSAYEEYQLFAPPHERVVSSVLENRGGVDEHEYIGREHFSNDYTDPSNTFMGTRVLYANELVRPTEFAARTYPPYRIVPVPVGYSVGTILS